MNLSNEFINFLEQHVEELDDLDELNAAWNGPEWNYYDIRRALQFIQEYLGEALFDALDPGLVKSMYGMLSGTNIEHIDYPGKLEIVPEWCFDDCKQLQDAIIREGVTNIGSYAFADSTINKITLPKTLTGISANAFKNCRNLNTINLPDSLSRIGVEAFQNCTALTEVKLPENCVMSKSVFENTALEKVIIPKSTVTIPVRAFYYCTLLKQIDIPDGVQKIENLAFFNSGVTTLEIPQSVRYLGKYVFGETGSSTTYSIPRQYKLKIKGLNKNEAREFFEQNIRTPSIAYHNLYLRKLV